MVKTITKKRVVSRKKHSDKSSLRNRSKHVSKKTAKKRKKRTAVKNSTNAAKPAIIGKPFKKGKSGNPKGRPKGSKNKFSVAEMQKALQRKSKKAGYESTYDYVAERFFDDDHVLTAIMKKMLADLKSIEQSTIPGDSSDNRKKSLAIQKVLRERCKTKK